MGLMLGAPHDLFATLWSRLWHGQGAITGTKAQPNPVHAGSVDAAVCRITPSNVRKNFNPRHQMNTQEFLEAEHFVNELNYWAFCLPNPAN
jgi:hypothetical protein